MRHLFLFAAFCASTTSLFSQILQVNVSTPDRYRYYLVVNNSDDAIVVKINNAVIYHKNTDHDPNFHDRINITDNLQKSTLTGYLNVVVVDGWNSETKYNGCWRQWLAYNPWHFKYHIEKEDIITGQVAYIVNVDEKGPAPNKTQDSYLVKSWKHDISKE